MASAVDIAGNVSRVRERICRCAARAGRDPDSIRLVAVSKTFPPERILAAYDAGLRHFGENRVQEFHQKLPHLLLPEACFHLIGHLQSNKVRQALAFHWIHTVDSVRLAQLLNAEARQANKTLPVLIEVKVSREENKTGVSEDELAALVSSVASLDRLQLRGLMTMPPWAENPEVSRPYFRLLRLWRERLQQAGFPQVEELSMGMSHDFEAAIEEGATMVRIGTAIFGPRSVRPPQVSPT